MVDMVEGVSIMGVHRHLRGSLARQRGVVTVEFAALLPFLVLFLVGIVEFGHLWYLKHALTNASREGARYGVAYRKNAGGNQVLPENITTPETVQQRVLRFLGDNFVTKYGVTVSLNDGNPTTDTNGDGHVGTGDDLTVIVTATNNVTLLLGRLLELVKKPWYPHPEPEDSGLLKTISSQTTMRLE